MKDCLTIVVTAFTEVETNHLNKNKSKINIVIFKTSKVEINEYAIR